MNVSLWNATAPSPPPPRSSHRSLATKLVNFLKFTPKIANETQSTLNGVVSKAFAFFLFLRDILDTFRARSCKKSAVNKPLLFSIYNF